MVSVDLLNQGTRRQLIFHINKDRNLRPSSAKPEVAITFVTIVIRSCDIVPLCIPEIHEATLKQQH